MGCKLKNFDAMKSQLIDECKCVKSTKTCDQIENNGNNCKTKSESCSNAVVAYASIFKWADNKDDPECKDEDPQYKKALELWSACTTGRLYFIGNKQLRSAIFIQGENKIL